jgi:D-amino-acid oxidase
MLRIASPARAQAPPAPRRTAPSSGCAALLLLSFCTCVRVQVGLRPARSTGVRLEVETLAIGGVDMPVVHNYGHGGSGITLHWGCVQEALALVQHCIEA